MVIANTPVKKDKPKSTRDLLVFVIIDYILDVCKFGLGLVVLLYSLKVGWELLAFGGTILIASSGVKTYFFSRKHDRQQEDG